MHMRMRMLRVSSALTLVIVAALSIAVLVAQAPSGGRTPPPTTTSTDAAIRAAAEAARAVAARNAIKAWTAPRTSWGDPDLQGVWMTATYTPMQRPRELGGKAFYTHEEVIAAFKKAVESDAEVDPRTVHYDWNERRQGKRDPPRPLRLSAWQIIWSG